MSSSRSTWERPSLAVLFVALAGILPLERASATPPKPEPGPGVTATGDKPPAVRRCTARGCPSWPALSPDGRFFVSDDEVDIQPYEGDFDCPMKTRRVRSFWPVEAAPEADQEELEGYFNYPQPLAAGKRMPIKGWESLRCMELQSGETRALPGGYRVSLVETGSEGNDVVVRDVAKTTVGSAEGLPHLVFSVCYSQVHRVLVQVAGQALPGLCASAPEVDYAALRYQAGAGPVPSVPEGQLVIIPGETPRAVVLRAQAEAAERRLAAAGALNRAGLTARKKGRADEAIAAYRQALEVAPDHVWARFNLACELARLGESVEVARHLTVLAQAGTLEAREALARTHIDSDFDALRADPAFVALTGHALVDMSRPFWGQLCADPTRVIPLIHPGAGMIDYAYTDGSIEEPIYVQRRSVVRGSAAHDAALRVFGHGDLCADGQLAEEVRDVTLADAGGPTSCIDAADAYSQEGAVACAARSSTTGRWHLVLAGPGLGPYPDEGDYEREKRYRAAALAPLLKRLR